VAEPQQPQKPDYEQAAKDVEAMRQQLHLQVPDRETTRRDVPPWNPASPYRSLQHTCIAALNGCKEVTIRDLEVVIARGKAEMVGTRSDSASDLVSDRIESEVAAADGHVFSFDDNRIRASYKSLREKEGRTVLMAEILSPDARTITFDKVRVHWPNLVKALHEAGFEITIDGKHPAKSREPATKSDLDEAEKEFIRRMKLAKERDGRYPARDPHKIWPERESYSGWSLGTSVSRKMKEAWAKDHDLTEPRGNPPRNSAKK
jgi:hypothetical protein